MQDSPGIDNEEKKQIEYLNHDITDHEQEMEQDVEDIKRELQEY